MRAPAIVVYGEGSFSATYGEVVCMFQTLASVS